ncbi:IS110 family transposase, partial [Agrobacterium rhizogenes]|nr:IS110 family transposase [Rhizobium rhizogenes]NTG43590.1 IS110 family transposase [Rhizobium rhizogenes]NTI83392.1 IS110 family transposase [Rhizobium rhizogenes]NTJ25467.1 IS110 family transposase [Rhizobium rhizogenes]
LLRRKPPKLAAVAIANKMARIAWKLMISGQTYRSLGKHTAHNQEQL